MKYWKDCWVLVRRRDSGKITTNESAELSVSLLSDIRMIVFLSSAVFWKYLKEKHKVLSQPEWKLQRKTRKQTLDRARLDNVNFWTLGKFSINTCFWGKKRAISRGAGICRSQYTMLNWCMLCCAYIQAFRLSYSLSIEFNRLRDVSVVGEKKLFLVCYALISIIHVMWDNTNTSMH